MSSTQTQPIAGNVVLANSSLAACAPEFGPRFRAFVTLAEAIRTEQNPDRVFNLLVKGLEDVIPFDGIAQFDNHARKVNWYLSASVNREALSACVPCHSAAESLIQWVHERGEARAIADIEAEPAFAGSADVMKRYGLRSACAVPLATAHRRLGSLLFASALANSYGDREVRFLSFVAGQIALAMDDALNFRSSQRLQERLRLLLDLTNRVLLNLDLQDVVEEITAGVRRVMECDTVSVLLPTPGDDRAGAYAANGDAREGAAAGDLGESAAQRPVIGEVLRTAKPVALLGSELEAQDPHAAAEGLESILHVPMISRDRALGILSIGRREGEPFTQEDAEFVTHVAGQMAIALENAMAYRRISDLNAQLAREKVYLEDEIRTEMRFDEIIGKSAILRDVLQQVETVAPTGSTVLIYGETGTGKELIARAVHNLSARKSNAFVKLNCAAIPTGLLESELFGHEKGAFTGAIAQRLGRFELAHGGSVFLDEIGEIPLELQPKLLRVLQEGEFERLGGGRTLRSDARLIAATNRDLEAMAKEQKFRPDLYYRLNVFPIRVPALRDRIEDIPLLVSHFVHQFSRRMGKTIESIPSDTMTALTRYHWPGNIRELQNVIERAVIVSQGSVLKVAVEELKAEAVPVLSRPAANKTELRSVLEEAERTQILSALENTQWVVAGPRGAAAQLGMKRSTLQARMQKLGIRVARSGAA